MSKMSGVVVKLNDDEEDEDEEDDAGLLSRRGYDDSDDDDLDDLRHQSGSNSRGRSVLKRLRGAAGGDKSSLPYPSMRSGTVMQLLNTLTICCVFFGMVSRYQCVLFLCNNLVDNHMLRCLSKIFPISGPD